MAEKTIQIADKPTLDEVKALLEDNGYGLEAIKDAIGSGGSSGGGWYNYEIGNSLYFGKTESKSTLPFYFYYGSAVVLNNEIHILGGVYSTKHYKWDGSSWTSVSTLPYNFQYGSAVVYNGEIHILGGSGGNTNHYKWTGSEWVSVSTLPYAFQYAGSAVVYNGEIHILQSQNHYKWDGESWTMASIMSNPQFTGLLANYNSCVAYNNEIHLFNSTTHWKWDGESWVRLEDSPYKYSNGSIVEYNGTIHLMGGNGDTTSSTYNYHYKWDGFGWSYQINTPYPFVYGFAVVYNNEIHFLGSNKSSSYYEYHYTGYSGYFSKSLILYLKSGTEVMGYGVVMGDEIDDTWEKTEYGSYKATKSGKCVIGIATTGVSTKDQLAEKGFSIF